MTIKQTLLSALFLFSVITLFSQDTVIVKGNLSGGNIWQRSKIYLLDGEVKLTSGNLLIQSGTKIIAKSQPSDPGVPFSGLTIAAGARVVARGTVSQPIIFTSEEAFPERGVWRGISIESDEEHSNLISILSYLSIRYAGGAEDGISGAALYLEELSERSSLDYIEVFQSGGDGIRIHGGDVDLVYSSVSFAKDDAYDWDYGWVGTGLHWFAYQVGRNTFIDEVFEEKSYAIEGKGNPDGNGRIAQPQIYNATLIGTPCSYSFGGNYYDNLGNEAAVCFKDNSGGTLANSLIVDFPERGILVEDLAEGPDSRRQVETGNLVIANNIWWGFHTRPLEVWGQVIFENNFSTGDQGIIAINEGAEDVNAQYLAEHLQNMSNTFAPSGIRANRKGDLCAALDPRPSLDSEYETYPSFPYPNDVIFFQHIDNELQKGAFSADELWLEGWSAVSEQLLLGESGKPFFEFGDGLQINDNDTLKVYCEEIGWFLNQVEAVFPCQVIPDLIASSSRRGNKRRPARDRSGDEDFLAFIQDWWYEGVYFGCDDPLQMRITLLIYDTIAPVIHPIPDGNGGLTATVEDCDEAWLTGTTIDTIETTGGDPAVRYQFFAEDYSGNTSALTVLKPLSGTLITLYADLDGDGYGRPGLSIDCYGPIPGFVDNALDCNDNTPIYNLPDPFSNGNCGSDMCENAPLLAVTPECSGYTRISLSGASRTIYPVLTESCGSNNFLSDNWFRFQAPAEGRLTIDFKKDFESAADGFTLEIYAGLCYDLSQVACVSGRYALTTTIEDLIPNEVYYVRVVDPTYADYANYRVCLLQSGNAVSNPNCELADAIPYSGEDCASLSFNMVGAGSPGSISSTCGQLSQGKDVWFSHIPRGEDSIVVEVFTFDGEVPYYSSLHIYQGGCGQLSELVCYEVQSSDPVILSVHDFQVGEPLLIQFLTNEEERTYQIGVCQSSSPTSISAVPEEEELGLQLFPNPTRGGGTFRVTVRPSHSGSGVKCTLLDMQGRPIHTLIEEELPAGTYNYQLKDFQLPAGLYWVQLQSADFSVVKKWIVLQ